MVDRARGRFRLGVGRHDRFGRVEPVVRGEIGDRGRQAGDDLRQRQRLEDHAGRERQHLLGVAAEQLRHFGAGGLGIGQARFAGAGIGVAGVDHQRADRLAAVLHGRQVGLADLDRRGAEAVQGEHAGDGGAVGDAHHQQVLAVGLLDAGLGKADLDAGDRFQVGGDRQGGIHGHGGLIGKISNPILYCAPPRECAAKKPENLGSGLTFGHDLSHMPNQARQRSCPNVRPDPSI